MLASEARSSPFIVQGSINASRGYVKTTWIDYGEESSRNWLETSRHALQYNIQQQRINLDWKTNLTTMSPGGALCNLKLSHIWDDSKVMYYGICCTLYLELLSGLLSYCKWNQTASKYPLSTSGLSLSHMGFHCFFRFCFNKVSSCPTDWSWAKAPDVLTTTQA